MERLQHGRRSRSIGYAVLAFACAAIAASAVGSTDRQRIKQFEFTSERPGKATGVETVATFPGATLETAVAKIVTKPARGTEIDTSVPERCKASDEELRTQGTAACPTGSNVGDGEVQVAELGSGIVTLFNARRETIFLTEFPHLQVRTVGRESAADTTQRIEIPEGFTLTRIELDIDRISEGSENYIETPEQCPKTGKWINKGTFTYRDGVEQRESKRTSCDRPEREGPAREGPEYRSNPPQALAWGR